MKQRTRLPLMAGLAAISLALAATPANTSSHREAPLVATEPQLDNTDFYAFVSPDKPDTVTMVMNVLPDQSPAGGPNFYPFSDNARYNVHIDNDHDAKADLTYRWEFDSSYRDASTFLYNTGPVNSLDDPTLNFRQTYNLTRINNDTNETTTLVTGAKVAPSHVGTASMPKYDALRSQAVVGIGANGQSFAGQADDPVLRRAEGL